MPSRCLFVLVAWMAALLLSAQAPTPPAVSSGAAERAGTYLEALARARGAGKDIVVFQRGSDWNRLGERLLADVWNQRAFAEALGPNAVLVVVDHPQVAGNPPVQGECLDHAEPPAPTSTDSAPHRLRALVAVETPFPPNEIVSVRSAGGATFTRQADESFLAAGANPSHDTLTIQIKARKGGKVLRLDFPLHESLPGRGPGRASNGNFAISEVEMAGPGGVPIRLAAAWASATEGSSGPWQAVDGISDRGDNLWNPAANQHQVRTLLLTLEKAMAAGAEATVRLICRSRWGQHVPGCLRASLSGDAGIAAAIERVGGAERERVHNAGFTWRGATIPRIAVLDSEGRPIASEDRPRRELTPASLAVRIRQMQALRARRDALWAQAEKARGPRKAELLMQSLQVLGLGGSPGHGNCYQFVQNEMRKADPGDESGCIRWLQFQPDPRSTPELVNAAYRLATEKKYPEAIALLDRELAHPGNRRLDHDQIQRILIGKYHVYRRWPGHEEQRLEVLRAIVALDATTYLGRGAQGYLAMFFKTPTPVAITYGWNAAQVQSGPHTWNLTLDAGKYFDHAGPYCFRILHHGGKDVLKIHRVALLDGTTVLTEAAPKTDLVPGGKVEIRLHLKEWKPGAVMVLRLEVEAGDGKTDVSGRFEVDPLL